MHIDDVDTFDIVDDFDSIETINSIETIDSIKTMERSETIDTHRKKSLIDGWVWYLNACREQHYRGTQKSFQKY